MSRSMASNEGKYAYVVRCELKTAEALDAYLAWLRDPHVADVRAAGAEAAEIVVFDRVEGQLWALETRYVFASREAFERYEREGAPKLRQEGLEVAAKLGGIAIARRTGRIALDT